MPADPLRVLVVDDDEDDFILTGSVLREAFGDRLQLDWERDWERALHTILRTQHDVYLIDYRLGARDGLYLLKNAVAGGMRGPVIILTGHDSKDTDLVAMEEGASDYLLKAELTPDLVERSIRYAIKHYEIEEQLRHLALYDPLTGVANRALFMDRLAENLALRRREENHLALLLMDLDHFKDVNDRLGHPAGDSLLRQVANRLMYSVRDTDTVARLGGDEFAVIAAGLDDPGDAAKLADKLMETMEAPINVEGEPLRIRLSMGIALARVTATIPTNCSRRPTWRSIRPRVTGVASTAFTIRRCMRRCAVGGKCIWRSPARSSGANCRSNTSPRFSAPPDLWLGRRPCCAGSIAQASYRLPNYSDCGEERLIVPSEHGLFARCASRWRCGSARGCRTFRLPSMSPWRSLSIPGSSISSGNP
jgi:diguanylate cyclase (GGDEF)-like protein